MLGPTPPAPFDPGCLMLTADLVRRGIEPTASSHHHVRHGVWIDPALWSTLTPELRHAAFVHATALCMTDSASGPVFARTSAAALWGLPRIGAWPTAVHTHVEGRRIRGSTHVRRHLGHPVTAVFHEGLMVTPVARTLVDLARSDTLLTAVTAADHALRHALCTRQELEDEFAQLPPRTKRLRLARLALDLADPASMSPGESLSRVQMYLLDLPRPRLQVEHRDSQGRIGFVDFGWEGVVGEFDGKVKYAIPPNAAPEEAGDIVWREKQREDRLRRLGLGVARWTWTTAMNPAALAATLAQVGIRPTARNTWFDDLAERRAG